MNHYMFCSAGNTLSLPEYVGYFEIAADGYCERYVEVNANGIALMYTRQQPADQWGVLPEGNWNETEIEPTKPEYGVCVDISLQLFESVWSHTRCDNRVQDRQAV